MSYQLLEYADRDMLAIDLANQLAGDLEAALFHEERVALAVPGGTTPGPVFDALCAADVPWDRVDVLLTDERWVPDDHPRSNTALLKQRLLVNRAGDARLLPLYAGKATPEEALPELEVMIAPVLPLGVVLLGMGTDMHTASLFPGADQLEKGLSSDAPILVAMRAPGAPEPRVTFSARILDGALAKHVVLFGDEKRAALEAARSKSASEAPIKAVLSGAKVHWAP